MKPYTAQAAFKAAQRPLTDISSYPVLTEEVGFPPSPVARTGQPGGPAPTGSPLGQMVAKAVSDVLGWKVKSGDTKGFVGALTQSFTLTEVEGHVESKWSPRTYAVQTDLGGGLTGAQASIYTRGKVALDQALPLLDGLYKLNPEALDEDVAALKAVAKSQLSELVNELAFLGGPRVTRVNQYFLLLLGPSYPNPPAPFSVVQNPDPDSVGGTLGNLRDDMGLSFLNNDFINSVEDETNVSNYRIISDYITSLAQTWLNNVGLVVLNTPTPFFGTQLVLLSRQLSVVAESVDEVRFTLDSVFVGPAERQTIKLFPTSPAPIFLEDLLSWIQNFATEEGPRLIQDGGKFGVSNTFSPVVGQILNQVTQLIGVTPGTPGIPPGFFTQRVRLSIVDMQEQIQELATVAQPVVHDITAEPFFGTFSLAAVSPDQVSLANLSPGPGVVVYIRGSGFEMSATAVPTVQIRKTGPPPGSWVGLGNPVYFRSEGLLAVQLTSVPLQVQPSPGQPGVLCDIQVANPSAPSTYITLQEALTVTL